MRHVNRRRRANCSMLRLLRHRLRARFRALCDSKSRVWPLIRGMKGQHDRVLGHAQLHQLVGQSSLCTVLLNPDLVIADIHMQHTLIDTMQLLPAHQEQLIMLALRVVERLHFHTRTRRIALGMALQQLLHIGPICLYPSHVVISSRMGSKTRVVSLDSVYEIRTTRACLLLPSRGTGHDPPQECAICSSRQGMAACDPWVEAPK